MRRSSTSYTEKGQQGLRREENWVGRMKVARRDGKEVPPYNLNQDEAIQLQTAEQHSHSARLHLGC